MQFWHFNGIDKTSGFIVPVFQDSQCGKLVKVGVYFESVEMRAKKIQTFGKLNLKSSPTILQ
jgi:hypothetical protein